MKNYFTIFTFVFLLNCSFNGNNQGVASTTKIVQNEISDSDEYSFEEYIDFLLNKNNSKKYPDINTIPD